MPKIRYKVSIEPISKKAQKNWGPEYHFEVSMQKEYRNLSGRSTCCRTKEEVIAEFESMRRHWEGMDGILHRQGDKVTKDNLWFTSSAKEITREDLLGSQPKLL